MKHFNKLYMLLCFVGQQNVLWSKFSILCSFVLAHKKYLKMCLCQCRKINQSLILKSDFQDCTGHSQVSSLPGSVHGPIY